MQGISGREPCQLSWRGAPSLAAMGNPSGVHEGDGFRLSATGQVIDELFGQLSTSGLLSPLVPTTPEGES